MSVAAPELQERKITLGDVPTTPPIDVTERASRAVQGIVNQQRIQRLEELAPDFVKPFQIFQTEKGRAPSIAELAAAAGSSEQDLFAKLGAACFAKGEPLPAEYRDLQRELSTAQGKPPTSAELAARAGVSEQEFLAKIGRSAATLLGTVYLRLRTVGAGCSGMQDKLDLDPEYDEKRDALFDFHGVPVLVDKRSLLYVVGATIDYHNELNRSGFSITNPNRKTTCGCGSSYSM
jgi:iron-sulfur cluster assembly protein